MSNVKKILKKKIPTKPLLISSLIIIALLICGAIYWFNNYAFGINEYHAAQERCGSNKLAVGYTESFQSTKLVYRSVNDPDNRGPVSFGGVYFCTDQEAEAAGYTMSEF